MKARIPRRLRILLIADDSNAQREFVFGRRILLVAAGCGLVLLGTIIIMIVSYNLAQVKARRAEQMFARLEQAESELVRAQELRRELEDMRKLQERLLAMLGVDQDDAAAAKSALPARPPASPLRQAAAEVVTLPPARWPVSGYVTQEFSAANKSRGHGGIDIAQPAGTPILAAGDGLVARAGTDKFLGNFLEIQHGLGYLTVYGHCSRVAIKPGAAVRTGQVIGYTGQTGEAAAPHLHFEIWRDGEPIDPRQVLRGDPPTS